MTDVTGGPAHLDDLNARATAVLALSPVRPWHVLGEVVGDAPFAASASGYELTATDGRLFIDWCSRGGAVFLGYRHPDVTAAITRQLDAGPTMSFTHSIEVEVAERLVAMIPNAEQVAFGKNGSDALNAAVRVARARTGRDVVLHHGFHGFHEWTLARVMTSWAFLTCSRNWCARSRTTTSLRWPGCSTRTRARWQRS